MFKLSLNVSFISCYIFAAWLVSLAPISYIIIINHQHRLSKCEYIMNTSPGVWEVLRPSHRSWSTVTSILWPVLPVLTRHYLDYAQLYRVEYILMGGPSHWQRTWSQWQPVHANMSSPLFSLLPSIDINTRRPMAAIPRWDWFVPYSLNPTIHSLP